MRIKKTKYLFIPLLFTLLTGWAWGRGTSTPPSPAVAPLAAPTVELSPSDVPSQRPTQTSMDTLVRPDSLALQDTLKGGTSARKSFLEDVIVGKSKDSLVYNVRTKQVYIYEKGDIKYQDKTFKADYMRIGMENREIFAHGRPDTLSEKEKKQMSLEELEDTLPKSTRAEFIDGMTTYTMDTLTYNFKSEKARIKGVSTQEGEGYLTGERVKKMPDNTINIAHGRYTTCDADHPHFFLSMTKSKTIPGKKSIFGPSYVVMEDVPIYFLGLPFGFFPMTSERKSGFLIPTYGEEMVKGFFIRDGGYYLALSDYADVALTAGVYTLGSWEGNLATRYIKKYRYNGSFDLRFSKDILGEKGAPDYTNMNNFRVAWSHMQDPKFRPNSTFAASVNFSTSGYSKYGAQNMNEYLSSQTNSSISYSKNWAGSPFSFSTNMQHSQNSIDTTISLSFPNIVFNVARANPFRRRDAVGKERWYEKINFTYTGTLGNNVTVKEKDLFSDNMFKQMRNGVNHEIPLQTSFNLFKYFNISPQAKYQERWYFQKIEKQWDPVSQQVVQGDTTTGFYRLYNYNVSASASTKIYGTYQFKKGSAVQAIRHMMTPNISFTYTPDFGAAKYGYYKQVQQDTLGNMMTYSPFASGLYGVPSSGESASISFGLAQTLEMKVRSKSDTTGVRKIKVIDNFSINSSYNLLADSLNLAPFSLSLRTNLFKNVGLNLTATLDPYQVNPVTGARINKFLLSKGKLGRLSSVSTSFGYSFNSSGSSTPSMNDINSGNGTPPPEYTDMFAQPGFNEMDPNLRRQMMSSKYYDFSIPWNLGLNYNFNYTNSGIRKNVVQTLGFNTSVTITQKWGMTFNAGFDIQQKKITPGTVTLTRDLHCWQMSFNWVPVGDRQSWSFSIAVKASTLKDLKYDRNHSFYDNLLDD